MRRSSYHVARWYTVLQHMATPTVSMRFSPLAHHCSSVTMSFHELATDGMSYQDMLGQGSTQNAFAWLQFMGSCTYCMTLNVYSANSLQAPTCNCISPLCS